MTKPESDERKVYRLLGFLGPRVCDLEVYRAYRVLEGLWGLYRVYRV